MVKVYITQSAWQVILDEVRFFASQKNLEAIVYPLFGFIRKPQCLKAPWEMLELEDIDAFVVTHAHAPLRKYSAHTGVKAKFEFSNDDERDEWAKDISNWSNPLCEKYPTLEIGNVHSHPFARFWTSPSSGGPDMDYHRIYQFWQHMRGRKVNSPLEIILCRCLFIRNKWNACCFAFDDKQQVLSLGKAQIIPDKDPLVRAVLSKPYHATVSGAEWQQLQQKEVPEIEAFDRFYWGWSTVKIKSENDRFILIHLPPQFPYVENVLVQSFDASNSKFSAPVKFNVKGMGYRISLREIISKFSKGGIV